MKIRNIKEKRRTYFKAALKWVLYYIFIFICFIFMTSGTWLKPILLIPAALCIAVNNGQICAAITGAVCGFLIDISCGKIIGYNAVILAVFCILISLIFELYLKNRFLNILIASAITSFIIGWLDYKFYYEIWNYDNVNRIFSKVTLPVCVYTIISTIVVYLVIKLINHFLTPKEHHTLEEAIKSN